MEDVRRRQRAEARRARATIHKASLSRQERDLTPVRGPDAVSLVMHLTRESYSLAGVAEPTYARDQVPVRFVPWLRT